MNMDILYKDLRARGVGGLLVKGQKLSRRRLLGILAIAPRQMLLMTATLLFMEDAQKMARL